MFDDGTTVVIEKLPAHGSLRLWDYIRALEESKDLDSTIPAAANPLRYDIGNWLGHFHNWGSEEHVVEKLQTIARDPDVIDQHCNSISKKLKEAIHQLPKDTHNAQKNLDKVLNLIRTNYAVPGKKRAFQILNGNFDLVSLHIMYFPLDKRDHPKHVPSVYVSDWRDFREGHPAFDLGSLMADLVVLHAQNTTLAGDVARGFTQGYFAKVKNSSCLNNKFMFHVLVHIGVCMIIRCHGLLEESNGTGRDKNTGKSRNTAKSKNTAKDKNNGNQAGNGNGGTANDDGKSKHTTNDTRIRGLFKYGLMIIRHAILEDRKWFLDRPLLCCLFDVSHSEDHPGPDKWELARKSSAEKSGDQVVE
ncbi:hypothetical protein GE21DRAFT_4007 [Neurospora crassa]|nr:hypothetical protein GE21DRAFT_4007 [Neurospora crassa]